MDGNNDLIASQLVPKPISAPNAALAMILAYSDQQGTSYYLILIGDEKSEWFQPLAGKAQTGANIFRFKVGMFSQDLFQ